MKEAKANATLDRVGADGKPERQVTQQGRMDDFTHELFKAIIKLRMSDTIAGRFNIKGLGAPARRLSGVVI